MKGEGRGSVEGLTLKTLMLLQTKEGGGGYDFTHLTHEVSFFFASLTCLFLYIKITLVWSVKLISLSVFHKVVYLSFPSALTPLIQ